MRLIVILLISMFLTSCISAEERERRQAIQAEQQQAQAEAYRNALSNRCSAYGFQPGTDAFANCIAQEHRAVEQRVINSGCQQARQNAQYWCVGPGSKIPGTAGYKCQEAQNQMISYCQ